MLFEICFGKLYKAYPCLNGGERIFLSFHRHLIYNITFFMISSSLITKLSNHDLTNRDYKKVCALKKTHTLLLFSKCNSYFFTTKSHTIFKYIFNTDSNHISVILFIYYLVKCFFRQFLQLFFVAIFFSF